MVIQGKFPSLNELIDANRSHRQKGNSLKRKSQHEISLAIMDQMRIHIDKPIFIHYRFYEPNKKRDLDNISGFFHKVFQDALVECHVIKNDNWQHIVGFSDEFFVDNKHPRIEVELKEVKS